MVSWARKTTVTFQNYVATHNTKCTSEANTFNTFPALYRIRSFNTVFKTAPHWTLSPGPDSFNRRPAIPFIKIHFITTHHLCVGRASWNFSFKFTRRNTTQFSPLCVPHAPPISFSSVSWSELYLFMSTNREASQCVIFSTFLLLCSSAPHSPTLTANVTDHMYKNEKPHLLKRDLRSETTFTDIPIDISKYNAC